jgi:hypothetical protein
MISKNKFMEYCWCRGFGYEEMVYQAEVNFNIKPPTEECYKKYCKKTFKAMEVFIEKE